jgi:hypothetical protein
MTAKMGRPLARYSEFCGLPLLSAAKFQIRQGEKQECAASHPSDRVAMRQVTKLLYNCPAEATECVLNGIVMAAC